MYNMYHQATNDRDVHMLSTQHVLNCNILNRAFALI